MGLNEAIALVFFVALLRRGMAQPGFLMAPPSYGSSSTRPPPSTYPPTYWPASQPPASPPLSPSPPPISPSPSTQLPSPSASPYYQPPAAFAGSVSFLGPASNCQGSVFDGYGTYDITTSPTGRFTAASTPSAVEVYVLVGESGGSCRDKFTGLILPFAISGIMYRTPTPDAESFAVVSPVTKLLQYVSSTDANHVKAAYGFVGVDASNGLNGGLAAIRSSIATTRRTGIRMVFADAALSSLVITAVAALAAFPAGTLPACATETALVNAVYGILAAHISASPSRTIALDGTSLLSAVVAAAATDKCGASNATLNLSAVNALLTHGSLLYQTVQTELTAAESLTAELTAMPLEVLAVSSRVLYVVQANVVAALADLYENAQAVQNLVTGWSHLLESAPVSLASMAEVLGLVSPPSATNVKIFTRSAGGLTHCQVSVDDVYQMSMTSAVTDDKASALLPNVMGPLVTVSPGCRDAVLSTGSHTVVNVYPLAMLAPFGADTVIVDTVAVLASAVFFVAAATLPTVEAHHIDAADYASVYHFFGVGRPDAKDALPSGSDFVRQNWPVKAPVGARAYILNLKIQAVLGPLSGFLSGLLGSSHATDVVAQDLVALMARDLLAGSLKLADSSYLGNLMGDYYRLRTGTAAGAGTRRRRLQVLSAAQLSQLLVAVASTVSQSSALLSSLDQQVAAAADSGNSLDLALVFQSAAQIASVQQTGMAAALTQLATAAATGDLAAVESLTAAFESSFTGGNLQSQVQSAAVDTSALSGMMSSTVNVTTEPQLGSSGDSGSGSSSGGGSSSGSGSGGNSDGSSSSKKGKLAVVAGAAVGAVGGVALAAVVILVGLKVWRARCRQHVSPRTSRRFDSKRQQSDDPEAGPGANGVLAMGAASLPPAPSGMAMAPVTPPRAAPPSLLTSPLPPSGPAPLPHTVMAAPEAVTPVPVSWPPLTAAAAADGAVPMAASAPPAMAPMA